MDAPKKGGEKGGEKTPKETKMEKGVRINPNQDIGGGPPSQENLGERQENFESMDLPTATGKPKIFLGNQEIIEPKTCEAIVSLIEHCAAVEKRNIESPVLTFNSGEKLDTDQWKWRHAETQGQSATDTATKQYRSYA